MKKLIYIFLAILFVSPAISQDNMFLVYSIKGNVSVIDNKVESKPKIGTLLNDASVIKISSN